MTPKSSGDTREALTNPEKIIEPRVVSVILPVHYPTFREVLPDEVINEKIDIIQARREQEGNSVELKKDEAEVSDALRGKLALITIKRLLDMQVVPVLVDDGGCSPEFLAAVTVLGVEVVPGNNRGISDAKRIGMFYAMQKMRNLKAEMGPYADWYHNKEKFDLSVALQIYEPVFIQMEQEKMHLATEANIAQLVNPILRGEADVSILDREMVIGEIPEDTREWELPVPGEDYKGYSPYQAKSETYLNRHMQKLIAELAEVSPERVKDFDLLNGTRAISNKLLEYFFNVYAVSGDTPARPDAYLNAVYAPILLLAAVGYLDRIHVSKFIPENGQPFYPVLQRKLETGSPGFNDKRDNQRRDLEAGVNLQFGAITKGRIEDPIRMSAERNALLDPGIISYHLFPTVSGDELTALEPSRTYEIHKDVNSHNLFANRKIPVENAQPGDPKYVEMPLLWVRNGQVRVDELREHSWMIQPGQISHIWIQVDHTATEKELEYILTLVADILYKFPQFAITIDPFEAGQFDLTETIKKKLQPLLKRNALIFMLRTTKAVRADKAIMGDDWEPPLTGAQKRLRRMQAQQELFEGLLASETAPG